MSIEETDKSALIVAIATREGTARELAKWYGCTVVELRSFVNLYKLEIKKARKQQTTLSTVDITGDVVTPTQLDDLWLTNKFERLKKLQHVADLLYKDIEHGSLIGAELATATREFRSYLMLAANELGQLLHRGSGDSGAGDTLDVSIQGIDLEGLK